MQRRQSKQVELLWAGLPRKGEPVSQNYEMRIEDQYDGIIGISFICRAERLPTPVQIAEKPTTPKLNERRPP